MGVTHTLGALGQYLRESVGLQARFLYVENLQSEEGELLHSDCEVDNGPGACA